MDRWSTKYTALATLLAALLAAVFGLGGVLIGAWMAAGRDDERADREFLRTQRIAVYGEYLGAIYDAEAAFEKHVPAGGVAARPFVEVPAPSEEQLEDLLGLLGRASEFRAQVEILAETDVQGSAEKLLGNALTKFFILQSIAACHEDPSALRWCTESPELLPPDESYWPQLATDQFVSDVREEIEIPLD